MMNTLFESKPRKKRWTGGTIFSVALHAVILFLAIFATARAGVPDDNEVREEKVNFVRMKKAEPPPVVETKKDEPPPPPKVQKAPPKAQAVKSAPTPAIVPPRGFKVLQAPIVIPTTLPAIDPGARITNEADFSGRGVAGGSAEGSGSGSAETINPNRSYAEFEVERQVAALSGTNPAYPESMRTLGSEGEVMAQFVVNEDGRVETGTFKVLSATNAAFTQAVRNALPGMRFRPAQIGKTNVSQVVQQAFVFKLNH